MEKLKYHRPMASFLIFLWYISITVFIYFSFSNMSFIYFYSFLMFSALRLKSTTNSWLLTISVSCFASWIYSLNFSQLSFVVLMSFRTTWISPSSFFNVTDRLSLFFYTKTSFSLVWVRICTMVVVFFFNLCKSSLRSSIFSFRVWNNVKFYLIFDLELLKVDQVKAFSEFFFFFQYFFIFVKSVSGSENLESQVLEFFGDLSFPLLPFLNFMALDWLVWSAVSGLSGNFSFQVLEGRSDFVAFGLFLIEFVLKFKGHSVVSVLSLLKLHSGLVDLGQDVQILMFIHWSLSCLIEKNVIFFPEFFDFALEHSVGVDQSIVSVFGFIDGHLKFFLDFFVWTHLFLHSCVLGLFLFLFLVFIIFLFFLIFLILFLILLMLGNFLLAFVLFIVKRL